MNYTVTFIKYYTYCVEAENPDEACDFAYEEFRSDMRCPIADTTYNEVEVEEKE